MFNQKGKIESNVVNAKTLYLHQHLTRKCLILILFKKLQISLIQLQTGIHD